jgi:hypothetical protein
LPQTTQAISGRFALYFLAVNTPAHLREQVFAVSARVGQTLNNFPQASQLFSTFGI